MKKLVILLIFLTLVSSLFIVNKNHITNKNEPVDMGYYKGDAVFIKDLGHPFSGPGLETKEGTFGLFGDNSIEIMKLEDRTELLIEGSKKTIERTIPQAGEFVEINWEVLDVTYYKIK